MQDTAHSADGSAAYQRAMKTVALSRLREEAELEVQRHETLERALETSARYAHPSTCGHIYVDVDVAIDWALLLNGRS